MSQQNKNYYEVLGATPTASITPSSASNKVFAICSSSLQINGAGYLTIYRDATNLGNANGLVRMNAENGGAFTVQFLDSPNTTSATTYQLYLRGDGAALNLNVGDALTSITLFEIKG